MTKEDKEEHRTTLILGLDKSDMLIGGEFCRDR